MWMLRVLTAKVHEIYKKKKKCNSIGKTIIKVRFVSAGLQVTDFTQSVMMLLDEWIHTGRIKQVRRKPSERDRLSFCVYLHPTCPE